MGACVSRNRGSPSTSSRDNNRRGGGRRQRSSLSNQNTNSSNNNVYSSNHNNPFSGGGGGISTISDHSLNMINLASHYSNIDNTSNNSVPTGRNKRLKKDKYKWKSDISISENELKAKRDEFWDTSPVFGGRIEIWNALKAAVQAIESNNYQLAQAIIDSAQITLPNGQLNDCYDELGNRYQLPNYVLSKPTNLKTTTTTTTNAQTNDSTTNNSHNSHNNNNNVNNCNNESSSKQHNNSTNNNNQHSQPQTFQIKLRFSHTLDEIKLNVNTNQTIELIKQKIYELKSIEPSKQRLYFGGKQLLDKQQIKSIKLQKNFVVQVIVREDLDSNNNNNNDNNNTNKIIIDSNDVKLDDSNNTTTNT